MLSLELPHSTTEFLSQRLTGPETIPTSTESNAVLSSKESAIDRNGLASNKRSSVRGKKQCHPRDIIRFGKASERRAFDNL